MWDKDSIIESLKNDYINHYKNAQYYEKNDYISHYKNGQYYEKAICDYIINKLSTLTNQSLNDIGFELEEKLDGVFVFNPQENPNLLRQYLNKLFYAAQDIYYCSYNDLFGIFDEEDIKILLDEVFDIDRTNDMVYIPKGTGMKLIGLDDSPAGWPTFNIHGFEIDFAGESFKLKPQCQR